MRSALGASVFGGMMAAATFAAWPNRWALYMAEYFTGPAAILPLAVLFFVFLACLVHLMAALLVSVASVFHFIAKVRPLCWQMLLNVLAWIHKPPNLSAWKQGIPKGDKRRGACLFVSFMSTGCNRAIAQ